MRRRRLPEAPTSRFASANLAVRFAREGVDVAIAYLDEDDDATEAKGWVEKAARRAVLLPGDIASSQHCKELVEKTAAEFGGIDILVNNAAYQKPSRSLDDISIEDWIAVRIDVRSPQSLGIERSVGFREGFQMPIGVRKSPKNEPAGR